MTFLLLHDPGNDTSVAIPIRNIDSIEISMRAGGGKWYLVFVDVGGNVYYSRDTATRDGAIAMLRKILKHDTPLVDVDALTGWMEP